jgi:hypothetical protein
MNIQHLAIQELIDLNNKVVLRIKHLRRAQSHETAHTLRVGNKVSFTNNHDGRTAIGTVMKVNRTRAKIKTQSSTGSISLWNVPMNMLTVIS